MFPELCPQCCGEGGFQEKAVSLMMYNAVGNLSIQSFHAKIRKSNSNVFSLFKNLSFKEVSVSKTKCFEHWHKSMSFTKASVTLELLGEDLRCKKLLREVSKTVKYGYYIACARAFPSEDLLRDFQALKVKLRTRKKTLKKKKRVASERCTRYLLALKGKLRAPKKTLKRRKSVAGKRCNRTFSLIVKESER